MTEWGVVAVIVTLVGLVATIVKPLTNLTKSITELTVVVDRLKSDQHEQEETCRTSHKRLWDHNEGQDKLICGHSRELADHEVRIRQLEGEK